MFLAPRRYESDLEAARKEIAALRKANAKLETAVDAQIVKDAVSKRSGGVGSGNGAAAGPGQSAAASKKLKTRLRNLRAEVLTLREQVGEWELKDRTFALHKRCLEDATKKQRRLARRCEGAELENSEGVCVCVSAHQSLAHCVGD